MEIKNEPNEDGDLHFFVDLQLARRRPILD